MFLNSRSDYFKTILPLNNEKSKSIPLTFVVFDTETKLLECCKPLKTKGKSLKTSTNQKFHVLRYGYAEFIKNGDLENKKEFTTKREISEFILSCVNGKNNLYVWGHNVAFDLRVGIDFNYFQENGYTILPVSISPLIFKFLNEKKRNIVFLDTFSFYKMSLEELGKKFGIDKIMIQDFNNVDDEAIKLRCHIDVQITKEIVKFLLSKMVNSVCVSLPQLSWQIMRKYLKKPIECCKGISENAYHGGRSELFKKGKHKVVLLDVNSMYASVMLNPLPVKHIIDKKDVNIDNLKYYLTLDDISISADVLLNIPKMIISPIPYIRFDKKLIFPIGKFRTFLNLPELKFVFDYIEKIYCISIYKTEPFLKDFIIDNYNKRFENNNEIDKQFYKLLMNSLYGKFGQHVKETKPINLVNPVDSFYSGIMDESEGYDQYGVKGIWKNIKIIFGNAYEQVITEFKKSPAVSSFICSYARARLYELMMIDLNSIVYCDTDAIFILKEALPKFEHLIKNDLGYLKKEKVGMFEGFSPKFYIFDEELKIKGVPNKAVIVKNADNYTASYQHFTNFDESLRRYKSLDVYMEDIVKTISLNDDKRNWSGEISYPITL